ncbi:MAG: hypothetical protein M3Q22_15220 [Actinomycetota bacterium]|nr:hypothetical protein [Actinomycetota bacterium]
MVLADVAMSRHDTALCTRRGLEATGLQVLDLPVLADIDNFPDAVAVAAVCGPRTRTRRVVGEVAAALGAGPRTEVC